VEKEHKADVVRLEILISHGGIYVDTDVFAFKSIDELVFNASYSSLMGAIFTTLLSILIQD
jgi:mannosyltransferase OCH1-like enzyme